MFICGLCDRNLEKDGYCSTCSETLDNEDWNE